MRKLSSSAELREELDEWMTLVECAESEIRVRDLQIKQLTEHASRLCIELEAAAGYAARKGRAAGLTAKALNRINEYRRYRGRDEHKGFA